MQTILVVIGIYRALAPLTASGDVACTSTKISFDGASVTGTCVDNAACSQGPYLITGFTLPCGKGQTCCFSVATSKDCGKIKSSIGTSATCETTQPGCRGKIGTSIVVKAECPKKNYEPQECCLKV